MAVTIVTRAGAGTQLTWNQVDANFTNLNSAVVIPGGTTGQVLAKNSGSDYDLTWTNVNVTPAGSNGQIQFNASGSFGSSSALSFAGSALTVGSTSVGNGALKLAGGTSGVVTVQPNATAGTWTMTLPTTAGTNNFVLTTDGTGVTSWQPASASSGIILNSTAISGGVSGRVLYDNAGVVGEIATTGSGSVVLATSPTLTTPNLGTPSVLTLTNANGLPVGGISATGTPSSSTWLRGDGSWQTISTGLTIGTTTITSGTSGRILYDNSGIVGELATTGSGNVVLQNSPSLTTPTLGVASATTINKVTVTAPATGATLTLADGSTLATSGAYSTTFTTTGTTTLTLPTSGTVTALGNSTTGSGSIVLATSPTLTTPNLGTPSTLTLTNATGLPVGGISATGTPSSTTYLRGDGSWQTISTGLTIGTTATSGGAAGQIMFDTGSVLQESSNLLWDNTNYVLSVLQNTGTFKLGASSDVILKRRAAANFQLGAADAAAPVAQTLSVQSVVAGTSNTAGTNFTINGSQGTGTGAGGSIIFQVAPAGTTGTSQNALATAMTIAGSGAITINNGPTIGTGVGNITTVISAGASGYPVLQWVQAGGVRGTLQYHNGAGNMEFSQSGGGSTAPWSFANPIGLTSASGTSADTLITRQAAGVVKVAGASSAGGSILHNGYTYATLPTGVAGMVAYITDSTTASAAWGTTISAGGGSNKYLCWYNGTNWTVIGA
jgi:hypothetical protein